MRLILMALALTACGEGGLLLIKRKPIENKEIKPYVEMFYADAARYGREAERGISYYLKEEELDKDHPTYVGICYKDTNGFYPSYFILSKAYWDSVSFIQRKALVYHELAHCALGLGHVEEHPSLIYPNVYGKEYLEVWLDKMIETLFTNDGVPK